jgi:hypothetical protein
MSFAGKTCAPGLGAELCHDVACRIDRLSLVERSLTGFHRASVWALRSELSAPDHPSLSGEQASINTRRPPASPATG